MTVRIVISKRAQSNINTPSPIGGARTAEPLSSPTRLLDRAWELLAELPSLGPPYRLGPSANIRRLLLPKSQHYVYYEYSASSGTLTVITVWSTRRGVGPDLSSA